MIAEKRKLFFSFFCAVDTLVKVLKEAETAALVVEQDPIGSILSQRAAAGKRWQDQARTLMANLKVSLSCQMCADCKVHIRATCAV